MTQPLTTRTTPRPQTTAGDHHAQLGVTPVPEVDAELRRRAFEIEGVDRRETLVSVDGTDALWVAADLHITRSDLTHDREFGHIHPDGSLHVTVSPERAAEIDATNWGEPPPSGHRARHPGRVMLFTPTTLDEVDVVVGLIRESFALVTDPAAGVAADHVHTHH